jgi:tripeptide aminopeptidase
MELARHLMTNPGVLRGDVRVCFTCDEEIGHGVDHVNLKRLGAVAAYTLDGEGQGQIENETFSADMATVTVTGVNIHPAMAKGRMTNAVRLASQFIARMPHDRLSPETTANREGFLHPFVVEGGVAETRIKILLRDFRSSELRNQQKLLDDIAAELGREYPQARIAVDVTRQYRNMADGLKSEPRAVGLAAAAMKACGLEPKMSSIRGGTDGSRLTEMGLPTPNLSTGMHNFHSPLEWACIEEMETAVNVLVELVKLWGNEKA